MMFCRAPLELFRSRDRWRDGDLRIKKFNLSKGAECYVSCRGNSTEGGANAACPLNFLSGCDVCVHRRHAITVWSWLRSNPSTIPAGGRLNISVFSSPAKRWLFTSFSDLFANQVHGYLEWVRSFHSIILVAICKTFLLSMLVCLGGWKPYMHSWYSWSTHNFFPSFKSSRVHVEVMSTPPKTYSCGIILMEIMVATSSAFLRIKRVKR